MRTLSNLELQSVSGCGNAAQCVADIKEGGRDGAMVGALLGAAGGWAGAAIGAGIGALVVGAWVAGNDVDCQTK